MAAAWVVAGIFGAAGIGSLAWITSTLLRQQREAADANARQVRDVIAMLGAANEGASRAVGEAASAVATILSPPVAPVANEDLPIARSMPTTANRAVDTDDDYGDPTDRFIPPYAWDRPDAAFFGGDEPFGIEGLKAARPSITGEGM